jgi:hypothetical protein
MSDELLCVSLLSTTLERGFRLASSQGRKLIAQEGDGGDDDDDDMMMMWGTVRRQAWKVWTRRGKLN